MNILSNPRSDCLLDCARPAREWNRGYPARRGDIRMCEHGNYWMCTGNEGMNIYLMTGFWMRLSPIWNPILYRRARKVLG